MFVSLLFYVIYLCSIDRSGCIALKFNIAQTNYLQHITHKSSYAHNEFRHIAYKIAYNGKWNWVWRLHLSTQPEGILTYHIKD